MIVRAIYLIESESKSGIVKSVITIIGKYLFCRLRSCWKA